MAATAAFASTPATAQCQISVANTARDGTGTLVDLITAPAAGTRVDQIDICAAGTVTAGVVRLFLYDGTNTRLWKEILVTATTPSTTVAAWSTKVRLSPALVLKSAWKIKVSTHNAETFNVFATMAGDLT